MRDHSEAVRWPTGRLDLEACEDCGFIQNSAYDPGDIDFSRAIEESQFSSATFVEFAEATLRGLDNEYRLAGRPVLEVGCGKGEWLAMACSLLGSNGVGIDPSYVPGRVEDTEAAAFEVITALFDGSRPHLTGGLVACRHTLEHVQPVLEFVQLLHGSARSTEGSVVFIEVPDTSRILREGAFWDLYYEHCSYFTARSLRALMIRAGLRSVRVRLGFGNQYLLATGQPAGDPTSGPIQTGEDLAAAVAFKHEAERSIATWQAVLDGVDTRGESVVLWGASSKAVGFLAAVERRVEAAVDINPAKAGSFLPGTGTRVIGPKDLQEIRPDLIVVMNPIYEKEISAMVEDLGVDAVIVSLGTQSPERLVGDG